MNKIAFLEGYLLDKTSGAKTDKVMKLIRGAGSDIAQAAKDAWKGGKKVVKNIGKPKKVLTDAQKRAARTAAANKASKEVRGVMSRQQKGEATIKDILFGNKKRTAATIGTAGAVTAPIAYGVGRSSGRKAEKKNR